MPRSMFVIYVCFSVVHNTKYLEQHKYSKEKIEYTNYGSFFQRTE